MPMILHRPLALQDLDNIWDDIAQDNPQTADHFIDKNSRVTRTATRRRWGRGWPSGRGDSRRSGR